MRPNDEGLLVRYWAGAKAAAGVAEEYVPVADGATVADVVARVERDRPGLRLPSRYTSPPAHSRSKPGFAACILFL